MISPCNIRFQRAPQDRKYLYRFEPRRFWNHLHSLQTPRDQSTGCMWVKPWFYVQFLKNICLSNLVHHTSTSSQLPHWLLTKVRSEVPVSLMQRGSSFASQSLPAETSVFPDEEYVRQLPLDVEEDILWCSDKFDTTVSSKLKYPLPTGFLAPT